MSVVPGTLLYMKTTTSTVNPPVPAQRAARPADHEAVAADATPVTAAVAPAVDADSAARPVDTQGAAPRGPIAAFVRFVVCGGGVGLLSSGVLLLLAGHVPFVAANAAVTVVSTLLATELHHRFTFGSAGGGLAGWRVHSKSALTLLVAYLFTTAAVLALGVVHPHPGPLLSQAVYLAASGLAGIGRFLVLRLLVFARRPARPAAPTLHRGRVTVAA
jgi:putative flippase GtrA